MSTTPKMWSSDLSMEIGSPNSFPGPTKNACHTECMRTSFANSTVKYESYRFQLNVENARRAMD